MSKTKVAPLIHFLLLIFYGYGIYIYLFGLDPPKEMVIVRNIFGGPFKYLTFWNMILQFVYFTIAFFNDIWGTDATSPKKRSFIQKVRDFMFSTIICSCGIFVTTSFWGLWAINRELIFPKSYEAWYPCWLNHNGHTTPLIGVLLEMWLSNHTFPSRSKGLTAVALFSASYLIWICCIAWMSGHWVYPVLAKLTIVYRAAFLSGMSILVCIFYMLGETLHYFIWGQSPIVFINIGERKKGN